MLKPGGTIAFATWPPELFTGRMFTITARYAPPPPPGVSPPPQWGDPTIVSERLGKAVKDVVFDRATMRVPALSPQHLRTTLEKTAGPVIKLVELLSASDPAKLSVISLAEYLSTIAGKPFKRPENNVRQDQLLTRVKV